MWLTFATFWQIFNCTPNNNLLWITTLFFSKISKKLFRCYLVCHLICQFWQINLLLTTFWLISDCCNVGDKFILDNYLSDNCFNDYFMTNFLWLFLISEKVVIRWFSARVYNHDIWKKWNIFKSWCGVDSCGVSWMLPRWDWSCIAHRWGSI